jgi:L-threonylcarbamoyladenylate synthase
MRAAYDGRSKAATAHVGSRLAHTAAVRIVPATPEAIAEAAARLREGGLVAFPTETVYGLGARARDAVAVRRVFAQKGRPPTHPLIAHVTGEAQARTLAAEWPEVASRLARALWPGPLTLVVPKAKDVPAEVSGGSDSIAIRAPAHPVALALVEALGEPVVAPSANRYQSISPTTAAHVRASLGADADVLVLDGGPCARGLESTVLDVRVHPARILRPGPIGPGALFALGVDVELEGGDVAEDELRPSPGMDARHYAPRTPLVLAGSDAAADELVREGRAVRLALPTEPEDAARMLYAELHRLDALGAPTIVAVLPREEERWLAVRDRLRRAARP